VKSIGHNPGGVNDHRQEVDFQLDVMDNTVNIIVIDCIESRDLWFKNKERVQRIMERSIVIYSGDDNPFTNDTIGQRLMKYLVLVKKWEGSGLASSIFGGVSVRLVGMLHATAADMEKQRDLARSIQSIPSSPTHQTLEVKSRGESPTRSDSVAPHQDLETKMETQETLEKRVDEGSGLSVELTTIKTTTT